MKIRERIAELVEEDSCSYNRRFASNIRKNGIVKAYLQEEIPRYAAAFVKTVVAGALLGELADHIPYIKDSIPHVMQELTGSCYFSVNLDKLGTALGFVSLCLRRGGRQ